MGREWKEVYLFLSKEGRLAQTVRRTQSATAHATVKVCQPEAHMTGNDTMSMSVCVCEQCVSMRLTGT